MVFEGSWYKGSDTEVSYPAFSEAVGSVALRRRLAPPACPRQRGAGSKPPFLS